MEQKVNEISVDRLISLEKENTLLLQQIGGLKSDKINLEKQIEKDQKEVKIITGNNRENYRGDYDFVIKSIETRNLGDVEEILNKKYQPQLDEKDRLIRDLTIEVENNNASFKRGKKEIENNYENYRTDLKIKLDKKIKDLEEELEKVKNDKTDEQEAKKRDQEIIDLKLRIKELEKIVKNLTSTNIFKRIWSGILDKNARVTAQKELLEKEELVDRIKGTSRKYSWNVFGF